MRNTGVAPLGANVKFRADPRAVGAGQNTFVDARNARDEGALRLQVGEVREEGLVAAADELTARGVKLVSGGTDNHLLLIDLTDEECTGKDLEHNLDAVHITANKNTVPGEKRSPFVTSGVRVGTPAVTTRGMGPAEMKIIADCIADCIFDFEVKKEDIAARVAELSARFPLYE